MLIQKSIQHRFYKTAVLLFILCFSLLSESRSQFVRNYRFVDLPLPTFKNINHLSSGNNAVNPFSYSINLELINLFALVITEQADHLPSFSQFKEAYKHPPVWDNDPWTINYVAHPLMGSETYLRAREAGYGRFGSFAFSTAMSVVWEYLLESWTEPPSGQDLLVTSTTGMLIGEGRYLLKQKIKPGYYWLVDPLNMLYISFFRLKSKPENHLVLLGVNLTI